MNELSWLEINLSRLAENFAWWRRLVNASPAAGPVRLCAVVKANAYGLGAVPVSQCLEQAGADMFAVYSPPQAEELIHAGIKTPILILMPTRQLDQTPAVQQAVVEGRLHLAVNDPGQLEMIEEMSHRLDTRIPVHLFVDTGMSRAGLAPHELAGVLQTLSAHGRVRLAGVFSHLATADGDDGFCHQQLEQFDRILQAQANHFGPGIIRHLAATTGVCRGSQFHQNMVRIGLGLWGYGPDLMRPCPRLPIPLDLQPVVRWLAKIIHIQQYPAGATVGYGRTFTLPRPSRLGVVPVGYADGYPLAMSNQAQVRLISAPGSQSAPVVGRVSMDQIVIDLTDAPTVAAGDTVELLSAESASPCSLPQLAALAQTIEYDVLCRLSPRLPRRYIRPAPPVPTVTVMKLNSPA